MLKPLIARLTSALRAPRGAVTALVGLRISHRSLFLVELRDCLCLAFNSPDFSLRKPLRNCHGVHGL
jgi:hypothetical protein